MRDAASLFTSSIATAPRRHAIVTFSGSNSWPFSPPPRPPPLRPLRPRPPPPRTRERCDEPPPRWPSSPSSPPSSLLLSSSLALGQVMSSLKGIGLIGESLASTA